MIHLAVLLRVHNRPHLLRTIFHELNRYNGFPGLTLTPIVMMDRPDPACRAIVSQYNWGHTFDAPEPILDGREHWGRNQNFHLDFLETRNMPRPDWIYVHDDDWVFEGRKIKELLVPCLADPGIDAYYLDSLYLHDAPDTYNAKRAHHTIWLYRHHPGHRFSGKRVIAVPDDLHDAYVISNRTATFPVPLFECGTYTKAERDFSVARYARAGRIDDFTEALKDPLTLHCFPEDWDPQYGSWFNPFEIDQCLTAPSRSIS
jgi:hypothetical protein